METTIGVLLAFVLGSLPLLGFILWWWYEMWYVLPIKIRLSGTGKKLPPGHMGFPFFGELLTFLWYFKIRRQPDEFINSKRRKYGDGVGLYRTHLFGSPSIITCFPMVNKFVLQSDDTFVLQWPKVEIMGSTSLVAVNGKGHTRIRSLLINAINRPDALRQIAIAVQPRMIAALESWAEKGRINAYTEAKKLTFENIGNLFISLESGPTLEAMDKLFRGLVNGFRAHPLNIPGTAFHYAVQCRKKLESIFSLKLEEKKKIKKNGVDKTNDLMDRLIQLKDDEGNELSDQEVIDNIVTLVIGGYESTSLASMWAIYYLAKYPDVLKKLREENMALCKNNKEHFITKEDVSNMKYTSKVVEETIRMANITVFSFRLAIKEAEYRGYVIPKNWKVILWIRYIHTNSENFEDPMCFNPNRWDESARPGTYQVFGGGSRICPGNMLARLQLALFLHHLAIGYKWELLNLDAKFKHLPHHTPIDGVEVAFCKI